MISIFPLLEALAAKPQSFISLSCFAKKLSSFSDITPLLFSLAGPNKQKKRGKMKIFPPFISVGRDDWIRTSDHLHPMQMRYQAALHPVFTLTIILFPFRVQVVADHFPCLDKLVFHKLISPSGNRNPKFARLSLVRSLIKAFYIRTLKKMQEKIFIFLL